MPMEMDVFADESPKEADEAFHGFVQVEYFWRDGLFAGKREKLAGEFGGADGRLLDFAQILEKRTLRRGLPKGQLHMAQNGLQHVVEIVGDAAGQSTHGFDLLHLVQLGL